MELRKCCNHPYLFEGAEPGAFVIMDERVYIHTDVHTESDNHILYSHS